MISKSTSADCTSHAAEVSGPVLIPGIRILGFDIAFFAVRQAAVGTVKRTRPASLPRSAEQNPVFLRNQRPAGRLVAPHPGCSFLQKTCSAVASGSSAARLFFSVGSSCDRRVIEKTFTSLDFRNAISFRAPGQATHRLLIRFPTPPIRPGCIQPRFYPSCLNGRIIQHGLVHIGDASGGSF